MAKWGFDLYDLDLWPWPFAQTSPLPMVIISENFMMIQWWEHSEQGKSEGFDSCDWPSNLVKIWSKSSIFQSVWPWNLMDDLKKIIGHLFYTSSSFVRHFKFIGQLKVTVRKRSIRIKIGNFLSRVTLKFDGWHWKTIGHLFYTTSSFVHHFKAMGEFKLELQSGNAQLGSKSAIFCPAWPWNLMDDFDKIIGYLFYVASSFVHYFIAIRGFKLKLQSGNDQFG